VEEGSHQALKALECLPGEPRNVNSVLLDSMCNQRKITLIEFLVYWVERGPIRGKLPWIPLWLAREKVDFLSSMLTTEQTKINLLSV